MNSAHPFDLVIGLDRSDAKADLYLIDTATGDAHKQTIATSPESLHQWLAQLHQQYPHSRVGVCLEVRVSRCSSNWVTSPVVVVKRTRLP